MILSQKKNSNVKTISKISITLDQETISLLSNLAKRENKSTAQQAKDLIIEALDYREDKILSEIALHRDVLGARRVKH